MKIFCSGIGGIGLSAYASHMHNKGHAVSGSDRSPSDITKRLEDDGIAVSYVQDGSSIPRDCNIFVYSEAVPEDAPERKTAAERKIRQISYFQALGELTKDKKLIAVCGTHGKSSTTAMAARMLIYSGLDPSVVVGTKMFELEGRNWRPGKGDWWIVEACEYRKSFHYLDPEIVLMTNVDGDHFDAYENVEEYENAFVDFLKRMPDSGLVITHLKDDACNRVAEKSGKNIQSADSQPAIELAIPGSHMQDNAKLVLALAESLSIPKDKAVESLREYKGSWRRMEVKGTTRDDILIIDDYAHHPIEIKATLEALHASERSRRLVCVFQPHTHERTNALWGDFTRAFESADRVIISDIYVAREDIEREHVDLDNFVSEIERNSEVKTVRGGTLEETLLMLKEHILKPGDLLVIMGAGNIGRLAELKYY